MTVQLPPDMIPFLETIGCLPRHLISNGYDEGFGLIMSRARQAGLRTVAYDFPTGFDCGTWIVPKKWTLHQAVLRDLSGRVLLDAKDNGLICMSYSQPFEGRVSREELFAHLHTHENLPDAIPFHFNYYRPQWGLCCSQEFKQTLAQAEYHVTIETEFSDGFMRVGEIILDGKLPQSFVLASHLCHPHQLNDGPIGAVLGIELLKRLRETGTNYTHRLLVMPETVGSAAWIAANAHLLPLLKGGLFAEMLTIDLPFVLNTSYLGDTLADRLFAEIVSAEAPDNRVERFNYGNDERQFNGPGVLVPMLALHRSNMSRFQTGRYDAYPEYHSERDNIALVTPAKLERALNLMERLARAFDGYLVTPRANFKGEPFLTRFGLQNDNLGSFGEFMDVVNMVDRELTVDEIARRLGLEREKVKGTYDRMCEKGLMGYVSI